MPYKDPEEQRAYHKKYHQLHREKKNAFSRQFHKEHREELNTKNRLYRKAHAEKYWAYSVKWKTSKLEQIAGRKCPKQCEICNRTQLKRLYFDHDHATGAFRGWLCYKCNTALGLVGDSPEILRKMFNYLNERDVKPKFRVL